VLQQGEESFIIAPVDRTATVYIWRQNSNKPKQITTPMAVKRGDGFSLVTPEGPRFYIIQEHLQKDRNQVGQTFAEKAMKRMPTSRGLLEEIKRRGMAKVFSTRIGNFAMYAYRFVVTGQIFNPIYVVAGIMMVSGWIFAGGASCTAFSVNSSKNAYQSKWQICEGQRMGNQPGDDNRPTVPSLTRNILRDTEWQPTLREDSDLYKMYAEELAAAFARADDFEWTYKNDKTKVRREFTWPFRSPARALRATPPLRRRLLASGRPAEQDARRLAALPVPDGTGQFRLPGVVGMGRITHAPATVAEAVVVRVVRLGDKDLVARVADGGEGEQQRLRPALR
jgi:hypothetical protein